MILVLFGVWFGCLVLVELEMSSSMLFLFVCLMCFRLFMMFVLVFMLGLILKLLVCSMLFIGVLRMYLVLLGIEWVM